METPLTNFVAGLGRMVSAAKNKQHPTILDSELAIAGYTALVAVSEAVCEQNLLEYIKAERESDELNVEAINLSIVTARARVEQALANLAATRSSK